MKKNKLLEKIRHNEPENRVPIIQEYLQDLDEKERQELREFYDTSVQALKYYSQVTQAEMFLSRHMSFGMPYHTFHQIACVAAGQPIRTPKQELQNNGLKIIHSRRNHYSERRVSRLMEQRPARIRVSRTPYKM